MYTYIDTNICDCKITLDLVFKFESLYFHKSLFGLCSVIFKTGQFFIPLMWDTYLPTELPTVK